MTLIKSISGIRGTIGGKNSENFTPFDTVLFISAFACWLKKNQNYNELENILLKNFISNLQN